MTEVDGSRRGASTMSFGRLSTTDSGFKYMLRCESHEVFVVSQDAGFVFQHSNVRMVILYPEHGARVLVSQMAERVHDTDYAIDSLSKRLMEHSGLSI